MIAILARNDHFQTKVWLKFCRGILSIPLLMVPIPGLVEAAEWLQTYEAETADSRSADTAVKSSGSCSGGGFVNMTGKKDYIEWQHVRVPSEGVYQVSFVYANGNPGMNPCKILANGSDVLLDNWREWKYIPAKATYPFPCTGGWESWRALTIGMKLKAGDNILRLTVDTKVGPHLDKITVTAPPPLTEPVPPPGAKGWARVPEILSRITPPMFPDRDFPVTDFGALGDGTTNSAPAFKKAIAACHAAGGGRVIVPSGIFVLHGPIHLLSKVNLHLKSGSRLNFLGEKSDYLPAVLTSVEGTLFHGYSPMIYAYQQTDVALTGEGAESIIDGGQSTMQWKVTNKSDYREYAEIGIPVDERPFGGAIFHGDPSPRTGVPSSERILNETRPQCIEFFACTNVLMSGYQVVNSPFWTNHPIKCVNVTFRNVLVNALNQNNDGFDPESCKDVLVEGCSFSSGDDHIAIKAGRGSDGWNHLGPCEDIVIRNCQFGSVGLGIALGSEMSGGVMNVFVYDCRFEGKSLIRMKTSYDRGGYMKDFHVKNVTGVRTLLFTSNNYSYRGYYYRPLTDGVFFENCPDLDQLEIRGTEDNHLRNFHFINCKNPKGVVQFVDDLVIRNGSVK